MKGSCVSCGFTGTLDRAHIKTKATGGGWDDHNILPLCRGCHSTSHRVGWRAFADKNKRIMDALISKGWRFELQFGVQKLVRAE